MAWEVKAIQDSGQEVGYLVRWDVCGKDGIHYCAGTYKPEEQHKSLPWCLNAAARSRDWLEERNKTPDDFVGNPRPGQIEGVGQDTPMEVNAVGAKQSAIPFRCDLLPPKATLSVAKVLHSGAKRYGDNNWLGIPLKDHINHMMTHALAFLAGDTQDSHLAHMACRALMALELSILHGGASQNGQSCETDSDKMPITPK